ncbi:MAG: thiamine phosphate synthase [Candidatus Thiodiazotropha sp.]
MTNADRLRGLYAITDSRLCPDDRLEDMVTQALLGGARILQYRDKGEDPSRRLREAQRLKQLCEEHEALLIINDDVALALQVGAHGVHLGRDDASLADARKTLGADVVIGISCYDSLELARIAARAGADYLAFGRFYPSSTKPQAIHADPALLSHARQELDRPLVAIGGITPENGAPLIKAGADMLAVVHGLFGQADIQAASRRLSALFTPQEK